MAPAFSVITPTFNCAVYLRRSYDCLVRQSVQDWEWIVVDDGSTDETQEIMHELASSDERIRYVRYAPNRGRGYARTVALENATGDWVVVWDADDMYYPDRLSQIEKARADGYDFFCSYAVIVDNDLEIVGVRGFAQYFRGIEHTQFPHATLACRLELAREIGYNPELTTIGQIGEDFKMLMVLSSQYRGQYFHDALMVNQYQREIFLQKTIDSNTVQLRTLRELHRQGVLGLDNRSCRRVLMRQRIKLAILHLMRPYPRSYLATVSRRSFGEKHQDWTLGKERIAFVDSMRDAFGETTGRLFEHSL